jgi:hypothetical protein
MGALLSMNHIHVPVSLSLLIIIANKNAHALLKAVSLSFFDSFNS